MYWLVLFAGAPRDTKALKELVSVCTAEPILFEDLTVYDNFRILNRLPTYGTQERFSLFTKTRPQSLVDF